VDDSAGLPEPAVSIDHELDILFWGCVYGATRQELIYAIRIVGRGRTNLDEFFGRGSQTITL